MIDKRYSKKLKKWLYGFDIRVFDEGTGKRKRLRIYEFATRDKAYDALGVIRRKEKEKRFGIAPVITRPSLADLIENHLPTIDKKKEKTRSTRVLKSWLSELPKGIKIDEITTPHIRLYVEKRQKDEQASSSINRELNIISAMIHKVDEYYPELAQWRPPKIPRLKGSKSRRERIISDEEYRKIIEQLTRPADEQDGEKSQNRERAYIARLRVAAIFKWAMNSGMRPIEIFNLCLPDIDYDGMRIRVDSTKTQDRKPSVRYVPLTSPLLEVLESQKEFKEKRNCIFTKNGNPNPKFYRIMREAAKVAGIKYGRDVKDGFVLYCARHTFTTKLLQAGLDLRTVGDITGHSDRELVLHYSHVTPESTAKAKALIEVIDAVRNGFTQNFSVQNLAT